jgi:hypothetical protein
VVDHCRRSIGAGGLQGQIQGLRKTMAGFLPAGTKLFVTETGISYPMGSQYSASYPTPEVLKEHAEAVVRTHLIMLGEGVDTSFLFYSADFAQNVGFGMYFNLSMSWRLCGRTTGRSTRASR